MIWNRPKYGNKKTEVDGIKFDSKKEALRYGELRILEMGGVIHNLKLQPTFKLIVGGLPICKYRADFAYLEDGIETVEDVKGFKTPEYKLKAKLFRALHPDIKFIET